ncbi:TonB-dependent receptor [Arcobacter sp. FWKO B]|uniref:TonB-dependent receptor n=1 Tax=Arcobacter sp. FWKO B TaxID=2593672 RepID=UPI0018A5DCF3|nr:TonB-dependent receptor [Arcobacter sp. FWKO B]QOG12620.1 TonB-dependent receptor [Arcobacter sp. FWKO B]
MKKTLMISVMTASAIFANEANLGTIDVTTDIISQKIENVSGEELKSADVAEALSKNSSSVNLIRRSGIANDILVRSQKKDNIVVMIDDAKVCGACPNRMDPPTSHIVTNSVEDIEIIGGPFDVEHMGTLSGIVKIKTKDPKEGFSGEINANAGSYDYKKLSISGSGGTDKIRVLMSASTENGEQYKDGDGNTFAQQLVNKVGSASTVRYADTYKDMDAFTKKTFSTKFFINPTDNSEIRLGYTLNRSDDILYPSSTMDAIYDDSDIYTFGATLKDLGTYSKELSLETYKSKVDHLMSTRFRNLSDATKYMDADVQSKITGAKLKNSFDLGIHKLEIGLDGSDRNWNGNRIHSTNGYGGGTAAQTDQYFIPDVDTKNRAIFAKMGVELGDFDVSMGARYDDTNVKANQKSKAMTTDAKRDIDYKSLSANILTTYHLNDDTSIFAGIGKGNRVPDAKELFMGKTNTVKGDLKQTKNYEVDFGVDYVADTYGIKSKVFHSTLKDYIYYHSVNEKYVNVDAKIYGIELSGYKYFTDEISLDMMASWQRGKKDNALSGQSDKDLADIVPLKTNIGLNYEQASHLVRVEMVAAKNWSNYDKDNGEQALPGYAVFNAKYNYKINKSFDVTVGMDNLFDKTYAVSNTYKDLTLAGTTDGVMLLNEPGRYTYANLRYKF